MTSERSKAGTSRRADGVHDEHGHEHHEPHGLDHAHEHHEPHGLDHAHEHHDPHGYDHGHEHHEPHGHDHGHESSGRPRGFHATEPFAAFRPDRERGFGAGKVLYFDAFSGVSGDMTVAALVDVGVPQAIVIEAVDRLGIAGCHLSFKQGRVGAIGALKFDVEIATPQQERNYATIDRLLEQSSLDSAVKHTARAIFRRLAEAEASVHRMSVDEVHFHEVGAVDSIADIVGAAACIEYIGATVWTSPLPLGSGFIECRHGTIPLPAPATVQCLVGIATRDAGIEAELVTPTGAAIIGTTAQHCSGWPSFVPIAVGWGAGSRILADRPNALRVVLGEPQDPNGTLDEEDHVVIEANVDDATGELVGHALGLLLEEGALDAWAVPITMKKGRPGVILSAIVRSRDETRLTALLIRETTTLGVRRHVTARTVRPRRMIDVVTRYGSIPVKVSEGPFGPPQLKPEFDSCVERAREHAVPAREVHACAIAAARAELGIDGSESSGTTR